MDRGDGRRDRVVTSGISHLRSEMSGWNLWTAEACLMGVKLVDGVRLAESPKLERMPSRLFSLLLLLAR